MKRVYRIASGVMSRVLPSPSLARRTKRMDPGVRHALAENVAEELDGSRDEWNQLENELAEAKERLRDSEAREQFLGMRLYKYQRKLREQALSLKQEKSFLEHRQLLVDQVHSDQVHSDDQDDRVECGQAQDETEILRAQWEQRTIKWEHESDLLQTVQEAHKNILVECETMRRKIAALESHFRSFQSIQRECDSFVAHAHKLEVGPPVEREEASESYEGDGHLDVEMSNLMSTSRSPDHQKRPPDDAETQTAALVPI